MRSTFRVAIAVGHSPEAPGAVNHTTALSEFRFNATLAAAIKLALLERKICEVKIFFRLHNLLPREVKAINQYNPSLALELHANASSDPHATGSECLYWFGSKKGKQIAEVFATNFATFLGLPCRGAKPRHKGERGWYFLQKTNMPAIICEPFFISNNKDLHVAFSNFHRLVEAYIESIVAAEALFLR